MRSFLRTLGSSFILPLILIAASSCLAEASTKYTVLDLGAIEPDTVTGMGSASGINNAGYVSLTVASASNLWAGFLWYDSLGPASIGSIGGANTVVNAINNENWIVGTAGGVAFVWDPVFNIREIGPLPGGMQSAAYALNDAGQVVGSSAWRGGGTHAVLWDGARGVIDLHVPGAATGINLLGQICGINSASGHAFVWTPNAPNGSTGVARDIGTLNGAQDSACAGINATGTVVGVSGGQAFIWDPVNGMRALPAVAGDGSSAAYAINDAGLVVGRSGQRAVEWSNSGSVSDLNASLTTSGAGWQLIQATGINAQGWIVGYGMYNRVMHGFALEPSSVTQATSTRVTFQTRGQSIWDSGFTGLKDMNYKLINVPPWQLGAALKGSIGAFGIDASYSYGYETQGAASVTVHTSGTSGNLSVRYPMTVKLQFPDQADISPGQSFLVTSSYDRDPNCGFTTMPLNPRLWLEGNVVATNTLGFDASIGVKTPLGSINYSSFGHFA